MDEHPADWYPDPLGRAELRYFDGTAWTEHVSTGGVAAVDPFGTDEKMTTGFADYLVSGANAAKFTFNRPQWTGTGHLFTEPVLVVQQQGSFVETSSNYQIADHDGTVLGSVRQTGQSAAKQAIRAFTNFDKHMSHTFEVLDAEGQPMLRLVRGAKLMKSKVAVADGAGNEIGRIVQENSFRKIRFDLEVGGQSIGQIRGTTWNDWNFVICDAAGEEIGQITKSFQGLMNAFLKGSDAYVVSMARPLEDPLRQMVIAAGVCIDAALHMDD